MKHQPGLQECFYNLPCVTCCRLHYTNAVVTEVMRINPAVPMAVPHRAVKNTTLNGYEIPQVMFLYILVVLIVSVGVNCQLFEEKISSCGTIQSEA